MIGGHDRYTRCCEPIGVFLKKYAKTDPFQGTKLAAFELKPELHVGSIDRLDNIMSRT